MKSLSLLTLITLLYFTSMAQDFSAYKSEIFVSGTDTLKYRILYPENYDDQKKYPTLLFLHGRGESGNNNQKQLTHGGKLFLTETFRKNYPSIIIFPQCAEDSFWSNVVIEEVSGKRFFAYQKGGKTTNSLDLVMQFSKQFFKKSIVDQNQIYVGGLSMGGMGTFEILRRMPNTFAAAFAICGGDNPANAKKYKNIPLWIFHGGLDDVVNPQLSYGVYRELKRLGNTPKFTIYPKANHNSWDSTFAEPNLFPWLFSHKK
jgi:predicted peptidase